LVTWYNLTSAVNMMLRFITASKIDLINKICVLRGKEWINAGQFGNTIKLMLTSDKTKV